MTEAQWINSSNNEFALQARRLITLHRALPEDDVVKGMLKKAVKEIRVRGFVRSASAFAEIRESLDQSAKEWDVIFQQLG